MAVDCVICFRDDSGKYFINPYITLLSIFTNTQEKIIVHILHDATIVHGRSHLEKLCAEYGHDIYFYEVTNKFDTEQSAIITERFNIGATYRYYIHELIDSEKIIYIDCDVIFNADILDLWRIDLGDCLIASTLDYNPYWKHGRANRKYKRTIEYLGLHPETYICSGLLIINLSMLRTISGNANIFVQKTLDALKDGITLPYCDMDIINSVAAKVPNSVLILDPRYNLWHKALHLGIHELQDTIFHYVSKPDKEFFPAHLLFWKYYAMSPFAEDMFERMSQAYCSMEFIKQYATRPRHRRHATELLQYGMAGMLLRSAARRLGFLK